MDRLKATMDRVKCERGRGVGRGDQENIIVYVRFTNSIRTMQRMSGCEVCREGYLGDIRHGLDERKTPAQTPTYTSQKRNNASVAVKKFPWHPIGRLCHFHHPLARPRPGSLCMPKCH